MTNTTSQLTLVELHDIAASEIRGVGAREERALARIGIETVADLLMHYPRRYDDRTQGERIANAVVGQKATFVGDVSNVKSRIIKGGRRMVEATLSDETGSLRLTFFNQSWIERRLKQVPFISVYGTVSAYRNQLQLTNPALEAVTLDIPEPPTLPLADEATTDVPTALENPAPAAPDAPTATADAPTALDARTGVLVPIYPASEALTTYQLQGWIASALRRCGVVGEGRGIADPVGFDTLSELGLISRQEAFKLIHAPSDYAATRLARDRLAFDELLRMQLILRRDRLQHEAEAVGITHDTNTELLAAFHRTLPFQLTDAQRRTITEIDRDLASPVGMHRLLQGDVGSGKTVVALHALVTAVANGHQGALIAPIEVLAEQHYLSLRRLLGELTVDDPTRIGGKRPINLRLLTGGLATAEANAVRAGLRDGAVDIVIGTHALLSEGVEFSSLSVVVVDEQHRFGVEQRSTMREQGRSDGRSPDLLVMTATPIPRTAALTVYGDLDVSVLDELPPGRTPVATSIEVGPKGLSHVWKTIRDEVAAGHQAFVVCPLIEDSEVLSAASAETTFNELSRGPLAGLRLGLLHGRLKSAQKEAVMDAFRTHRTDVLVATTVVEVGVDVPNATVMAVLNADRFGMAPLHQLRGRVGRSSFPSVCLLAVDGDLSESAKRRLDALAETTDGFKLAEIDLTVRGEGTLFAQHQSGRSDLKLASVLRDRKLIERARELAKQLIPTPGALARHALLAQEVDWFAQVRDADYLQRS